MKSNNFPLLGLLILLVACSPTGSQKQFAAADSPLAVKVQALTRNDYQAKYEPQKGVLHGAGQDIKSFKEYAKVLGPNRHPIFYMTYIGITASKEEVAKWGLRLKEELNSLPSDVMPQIGLNMTGGNDDGSGQTGGVAEGQFDEQIAVFIAALKDIDRKCYVRIGYEFEGSWNGYAPDAYVASFIKITQAMRDAELSAATVWCSGGGSANFMPWPQLAAYYPGDEWVDWWGIDIFSPEEITDPRLITFLQKADSYQKPVMIGETTPRYVGTLGGTTSWNAWFKPFFQLVYENPQIKAISYINWDWAYWSDSLGFEWHDWQDARLEQNDSISQAYVHELSKELFIHAKNSK
ncbi:MAG: glycosyl hydrolase [Bacteroidota bacterium]